MKKLYTLLLGVAVALTAAAGANTVQLKANRAAAVNKLAGVALQAPQMTKAHAVKIEGLKLNNNTLLDAQKQQGASRIDIKETWEDAGTVVFSDPWVIPGFADSPADVQQLVDELSWEVPVQKSSRGDRFKLIKPYDQPGFKALFEGTEVTCTFTDPQDLIIDCTKPNQVSIDAQCVGHYVEAEMDFYVQDLFSFFLSQGYQASVVMNAGYMPSTYKNGVITINIGVFGDAADNMGYSWRTEAKETLEANGYVKFSDAKDYTIEAVASADCVNSGELSVIWKAGADVAAVKYLAFPGGWFEASEENFSYIESELDKYLQDVDLEGGLRYPDAVSAFDRGLVTFFFLLYNADGTRVDGSTVHVVVDPDNYNGPWKTVGTCKYTDDLISSAFGYTNESKEWVYWDVCTIDALVQENEGTPGLYRIVNPYINSTWPYAEVNSHSAEHNHYLYIDATDPEKVVIPESYVGFELGGSNISVMSTNYYYTTSVQGGKADESLWGTLKDGVITFPETVITDNKVESGALLVGEIGGGNLSYANLRSSFKLDLTTAGINDAVIDLEDNATVEYFNLQGVRVANPSAGELVIKRQGEKVSKTIVR